MGASLFDLLPEAVELVDERLVFMFIAFGFIMFYFLERFIYWYHSNGHSEGIERARGNLPGRRDFAYLNVIGNRVHNFIDGMVIAASFSAGFQVGVATAIAVIFGRRPRVWGGGP